ncbi:MAG: protein-L-isoaspartate(D-aspartate) O-methyltransferase [Acidithiobacillus sp.]|uniref:protein-L-isoaspartate(D-aspartate) O-methyltransferase n=1 Tax=Acidithiobacillus sp. TaxID=1872118 RepID=UPI003D01E016
MLPHVSPEVGMISPRTRARMVARLRKDGIADERVLAAMAELPRHLFVAEALSSRAYEPISLPIGFGQTISQPWVVARMLEVLLREVAPQRVLEIGTGSGYHAALLAMLGMEVFSIERIEALQRRAAATLGKLGLRPHLRHGDGALGWPERAPFDAIVFTAAVPCALPPLFAQLRPGGILLMPMEEDGQQRLCLRRWDGARIQEQDLGPCHFVPLLAGTVSLSQEDTTWIR